MDVDYGAMSVSQLMAMYEEQGDTCTHQHDGSDDDQRDWKKMVPTP